VLNGRLRTIAVWEGRRWGNGIREGDMLVMNGQLLNGSVKSMGKREMEEEKHKS
jgi:hypothetical protein